MASQRGEVTTISEELYEELGQIWLELKQIRSNLDKISEMSRKILKHFEESNPLDAVTLLSLPDHLRKTALVMLKMGEASASMVAKDTGRARAVESSYMNQLVRMGYMKQHRKGQTVYFSVGIL